MRKTLIIYDVDGTLINSMSVHNSAWLELLEEYDLEPFEHFMDFQAGRIFNETIEEVFKNMSLEKKNTFEKKYGKLTTLLIEEMHKRREDIVKKKMNTFTLFSGVEETLKELKKLNIELGVCTSATQEQLRIIFEHFPTLKELFNPKYIDVSQVGILGKPHADPLLRILKQASKTAEEVLFVGDAITDYLASEGAEIDFLLFNPLKKSFPFEVKEIRSHKEIFKYLEQSS